MVAALVAMAEWMDMLVGGRDEWSYLDDVLVCSGFNAVHVVEISKN